MSVFKNIQSAVNSNEFKWHVINDNEVHSFITKKEASQDAKEGKDHSKNIEVISQSDAKIKYF